MKDFHDKDMLHRDIKPENFVLDKDKKIYIIDLGLSCINTDRELTQFIGNKRYASYNCHSPKYVYTIHDDIISVIYMLLDLYTKKLPWDKDPTYEIKKNTDYFEFYKKKDYFVTILLTMYTKVGEPEFYKNAIFELSRTIDYCKLQSK
jgi:serine/threonine protein kinase